MGCTASTATAAGALPPPGAARRGAHVRTLPVHLRDGTEKAAGLTFAADAATTRPVPGSVEYSERSLLSTATIPLPPTPGAAGSRGSQGRGNGAVCHIGEPDVPRIDWRFIRSASICGTVSPTLSPSDKSAAASSVGRGHFSPTWGDPRSRSAAVLTPSGTLTARHSLAGRRSARLPRHSQTSSRPHVWISDTMWQAAEPVSGGSTSPTSRHTSPPAYDNCLAGDHAARFRFKRRSDPPRVEARVPRPTVEVGAGHGDVRIVISPASCARSRAGDMHAAAARQVRGHARRVDSDAGSAHSTPRGLEATWDTDLDTDRGSLSPALSLEPALMLSSDYSTVLSVSHDGLGPEHDSD